MCFGSKLPSLLGSDLPSLNLVVSYQVVSFFILGQQSLGTQRQPIYKFLGIQAYLASKATVLMARYTNKVIFSIPRLEDSGLQGHISLGTQVLSDRLILFG